MGKRVKRKPIARPQARCADRRGIGHEWKRVFRGPKHSNYECIHCRTIDIRTNPFGREYDKPDPDTGAFTAADNELVLRVWRTDKQPKTGTEAAMK